MRMNLAVLVYLCVGIIPLVPNLIGGREMNERQDYRVKRTVVPRTEDMRKWQWYLTDTAVSMNVKAAWQAGYTGKGILVAVVDDGVKIDHPDLKSNFNLTASYDFLDNRHISTNYNPGSHGTNCAGIIAGADNKKCGVGVAFGAQISSIRLYNDKIHSTDQSEAKALKFRRDIIDIYSNSWGPGDMGWQVEGPGPQLEKTLEEGTQLGRRGKGSIFVFAAGNGGIAGDSCAFSGYVNNIHTIAISGVNWDGSVPAYTEQCAGIMAVTYGQDMFVYGKIKPPLVTAKGASDCTERFPGTSGTTAMASGIIALALQANPDLTWRDIQHLIARSSKPLKPPSARQNGRIRRLRPVWRINAAGLTVSSHFGFGLMDAGLMTEYAKEWRSVPKQLSCEVKLNVSSFNSSRLVIPSYGNLHLTLSLSLDDCSIRYLEHMQAKVNLQFPRRGNLEMSSTSPGGTPSKLLYSRRIDSLTGYKNFTNWRVTSLHYWGEKPIGDWNITIGNAQSRRNTRTGRVFGLKLIFYGTEEDPLTNNLHVDRRTKKMEAVQINRREKEIPIHGGYTRWSWWSGCSRTCGGGIQYRYRYCTNPRPENGGRDCSGLGRARESRRCNRHTCPVHGRYSPWGSWSQCDVTCGVGNKQRRRTCTNPAPAYGGRNCVGSSVQTQSCRLKTCPPVDGGYSDWSSWSLCSATCNNGTQDRLRSCTNPPPANGGKQCTGSDKETRICGNPNKCPLPGFPIDGGYSQWGAWSPCNQTCAGGTQERSRSCTSPSPQNGGKNCSVLGLAKESRSCNSQKCPACTNSVGDSVCQRWSRHCSIQYVKDRCKKTCGICQVCTNRQDDSFCQQWFNGGYCSYPGVGAMCEKTCGRCQGFPIDGGYSQWSAWSSCSRTCAGGTQQRSRSCTTPRPQNGGRDCSRLGRAKETRTCNTQRCPACTNMQADSVCQQWYLDGYCSSPGVGQLCKKTCGSCLV